MRLKENIEEERDRKPLRGIKGQAELGYEGLVEIDNKSASLPFEDHKAVEIAIDNLPQG